MLLLASLSIAQASREFNAIEFIDATVIATSSIVTKNQLNDSKLHLYKIPKTGNDLEHTAINLPTGLQGLTPRNILADSLQVLVIVQEMFEDQGSIRIGIYDRKKKTWALSTTSICKNPKTIEIRKESVELDCDSKSKIKLSTTIRPGKYPIVARGKNLDKNYARIVRPEKGFTSPISINYNGKKYKINPPD